MKSFRGGIAAVLAAAFAGGFVGKGARPESYPTVKYSPTKRRPGRPGDKLARKAAQGKIGAWGW